MTFPVVGGVCFVADVSLFDVRIAVCTHWNVPLPLNSSLINSPKNTQTSKGSPSESQLDDVCHEDSEMISHTSPPPAV
ncbi:hypothetical protein EYF80_057627 [Liparis tanakae]|uniref:Uncharacterized protein n=1 Tax=Liparis tanakae TaxID=230148 RepID=A0A4Z2ETH7_9TELE|nr:hypothetical protein EYF80_057627 [Liparis tanakae]